MLCYIRYTSHLYISHLITGQCSQVYFYKKKKNSLNKHISSWNSSWSACLKCRLCFPARLRLTWCHRVYKVDHHPNGHGSHICSSRIRNVSLKNSLNSVSSVSERDFASKSSISLTTLQTWRILEPLQKGHLGNITHVNKRNTLEKASPKHPAPLIQANPP